MRRVLFSFVLMGSAGFAIGLAQEQELLGIKRVFVEQLNGGDSAYQIRDLIVSALQNSKLFVVTENRERADVIMRGSADDTTFEDSFQSSDSINARAFVGNGNRSASKSDRSTRAPADMSVGQNESARINERKHEAIATVRLINKDGDVIWSTTQESLGAKFRGASADVADKVTRQLAADIEKAKKAASSK